MKYGHIPLGRTFDERGAEKSMEEDALDSYAGRLHGKSGAIDWDNIYREDASCVILGEPGSGKSEELREQEISLRSAGRPAAYVDLKSLLSQSIPGLNNAAGVIERWRNGSEIAWFFLDSVDESKLQRVPDFHAALKRMGEWVGADAARARFVISSRISEWRPASDKRLVESELLARTPLRPHGKSTLRILKLRPLSDAQARAYLAGRGDPDNAFFAAVEAADAWDFIRRPLDVTDLYALWQQRGYLGTLREVIDNSIQRLLEDRRERASLSPERAREGAEHLAACFALNKSVSVIVDDAALPDANDTLMLRDCLPRGWSAVESTQLLQCALFDDAAYGKVRFHHRSYQDYLAACWLARLMRADCPPSELRHLLFAESPQRHLTPRPSLVPVAAWLATIDTGGAHWQEAHRQDLLNSAPWVFFSHGDPRNLSLDNRREVLRRTVEQFKGRDHVQVDWDAPTLKRFADPALAPALAQWITDPAIATDLRADYVALVRHGKLLDAMPGVVSAAIESAGHEYLRATALACVAEIGTPEHRAHVVAAFGSVTDIPIRLGVWLAQVAYPGATDECGLFELLGRMNVGASRMRSSSLYSLDHYFESEVPEDRIPALLQNLLEFLRDDDNALRKERSWAADWLVLLLTRLLNASALTAAPRLSAIDALCLLAEAAEQHLIEHWSHDKHQAIEAASRCHPELRRGWYWQRVEMYRRKEGKEPEHVWQIDDYYAPLKRHPSDFAWWTADARDRPSTQDRIFALRAALDTHVTGKGARPLLPPLQLIRCATGESALRGEIYLYGWRNLSYPWYRLRRQWQYNWTSRHHWEQLTRPAVTRYRNLRNRLHLWWGRGKMARGAWWGGCWFVIERARADQSTSGWGARDFSKAAALYGWTVTRAAMAGADRHWRLHSPELPHEKSDRNQTSAHTILGLTALQIAWETQGARYFQILDESEVDIATRYALDELNGLPPWFAAIAAAHPMRVGTVLSNAIDGEWHGTPADSAFSSRTLQRLIYATAVDSAVYVSTLERLLQGPPPVNALVLRDALGLVLRHGRGQCAWLSPRALAALQDRNGIDEGAWPWLICLFMLDADRGIESFKQRCQQLESKDRRQACEALCANLSNRLDRGLSVDHPDYLRPAFLCHFIPWVHGYIRDEDDIEHDGVYSPNTRDNAQDFRQTLWSQLTDQAGDAADLALARIAADPQMRRSRDYVLTLIDRRRSNRADDFRIEPSDVHALIESHERIPRNRADLFHTAWSRLRAFKERVESAENTLRHECGAAWQEADYQRWLQRHLLAVANGRYTVPREAEVDPRKFPDLRFESPPTDGAVSVEVKVASQWSGSQLEDGLCKQLVGQYLRAANAMHGVYLLIRTDPARTWETQSGAKLSWVMLISSLQTVAQELVKGRSDIERLEVLGIDVTAPSGRQR